MAQISAGAIVARVKVGEAKIEDLHAAVRMEITREAEVVSRTFDLWLARDGVDYRALIALQEPASMRGTKFLVHATRGARNQQWAYFPDLDLTRSIPGKQQDDPFLGSLITYADLAGGAHLDDLKHTLLGEEDVDGEESYFLEGVPRHATAYSKLQGWVRKADYVIIKARFFDGDGEPLKQARLLDVRELAEGARLAHRVEVESLSDESRTVLTFDNVSINQGLDEDMFEPESLGTKP
jgi:outer membrane lipoprotein-sorting protein